MLLLQSYNMLKSGPQIISLCLWPTRFVQKGQALILDDEKSEEKQKSIKFPFQSSVEKEHCPPGTDGNDFIHEQMRRRKSGDFQSPGGGLAIQFHCNVNISEKSWTHLSQLYVIILQEIYRCFTSLRKSQKLYSSCYKKNLPNKCPDKYMTTVRNRYIISA